MVTRNSRTKNMSGNEADRRAVAKPRRSRKLILPCHADGTPSNPSDVLAHLLHESDQSKYVILRTVQCLVNNKVRLTDAGAMDKVFQEGGVTTGPRPSFGGHLLMTRVRQEFDEWVEAAVPNAKKMTFKPLTPEVEAWFSALPTKADLAWSRLERHQ